MARYVTRDELIGYASNLSLVEAATFIRSRASRSAVGSTFLSHSSKDEDLVVGATKVLENHGGHVYVDEKDPDMPPSTSEKTAELLKERITQSRKFVLLTSENSKESRWVPWELGFADGKKGLSNIALFPASDYQYEKEWASWEYLGLYRRIAYGKLNGYEGDVWMVLDEKKNTADLLKTWLAGY